MMLTHAFLEFLWIHLRACMCVCVFLTDGTETLMGGVHSSWKLKNNQLFQFDVVVNGNTGREVFTL